jgi:sigma-B regulation protein RsbU (phosphoserine phosphatase)
MLLRTRISLIALAALAALALTLVWMGREREAILRAQAAEALTQSQAALWAELSRNRIGPISELAAEIAVQPRLVSAMEAGNREAVSTMLRSALAREKDPDGVNVVEATARDGTLLYTSSDAVFPEPIISISQRAPLIADMGDIAGIGYSADNGLLLIAARAVHDPSGAVIGAITVAAPLSQTLRKVAGNLGAPVVVVSRRGRLLAGSAEGLWERISAGANVARRSGVQEVAVGGRTYALSVTPIDMLTGASAAWLVAVRDTTESTQAAGRLQEIALAAAAAIAVGIIALLFTYVRLAFAPVTGAIQTLNALARGDMSVSFAGALRGDEVGRIGQAVAVFREQMMSLEHMKVLRDRHRRRQERLIRRQMTSLATTLEDDARAGVMADLAEIEKVPDDGEAADGIAMVALALGKLTGRVMAQQSDMRGLIAELKEALASKNAFVALQQELDIARRMQLAILPDDPPPGARHALAGTMIPAREVGGDFYDFFDLGDGRLAICVADVSGKGVAAAFLMAITRTLLRATAATCASPAETLARVNDLVAAENDEGMFITMLLGFLDPATGTLVYASAGHQAPVRLAASGASPLAVDPGVALGVFEGLAYTDHVVALAPGDRLFLYTDGVTEAQDATGALFGEARLAETLSAAKAADVAALNARILDAVHAFEAGAPRFDDITCVTLEIRAG